MDTKVGALLIACVVMLVTTASASSAISITDAEAVYETDLTSISVPTDAVPLKTVFIAATVDASTEQDLTTVSVPTDVVSLRTVFIASTTDASIEQDLTGVNVPTSAVPIKDIFIHNEEAAVETELCPVNVPTSPVPVKRIFIHNEDAKRFEELVYPKGLIKDFIAPVITNITVTGITDNSALIKWDTDEFAVGLVKYGKTSGVYTESEEGARVVKNHTVELTGLLPDTDYYFVVNSTDRSENSVESAEGSFCTLEGPAPTPTPTPTPQGTVFDTGLGTYPSISGTHNGTLKPNQTVKVSELYTYPCPGTGGHTEYAKIWNDSGWHVTANWSGYKDDWRNISFDSNFTLEAGETYNYTLITGSYPQIHHTGNLSTSTGVITCSEFVDANGRRYENWIPAIRLWAG
jgi:chitodextrinase